MQRMRLKGERSTAGGLGQVGCLLKHGIARAESWNARKIVHCLRREAWYQRRWERAQNGHAASAVYIVVDFPTTVPSTPSCKAPPPL
jgi:hypothetical protein